MNSSSRDYAWYASMSADMFANNADADEPVRVQHQARQSPDGDMIVSCGNDQSVRLWDYNSGAEKADLRGTLYYKSRE